MHFILILLAVQLAPTEATSNSGISVIGVQAMDANWTVPARMDPRFEFLVASKGSMAGGQHRNRKLNDMNAEDPANLDQAPAWLPYLVLKGEVWYCVLGGIGSVLSIIYIVCYFRPGCPIHDSRVLERQLRINREAALKVEKFKQMGNLKRVFDTMPTAQQARASLANGVAPSADNRVTVSYMIGAGVHQSKVEDDELSAVDDCSDTLSARSSDRSPQVAIEMRPEEESLAKMTPDLSSVEFHTPSRMARTASLFATPARTLFATPKRIKGMQSRVKRSMDALVEKKRWDQRARSLSPDANAPLRPPRAAVKNSSSRYLDKHTNSSRDQIAATLRRQSDESLLCDF